MTGLPVLAADKDDAQERKGLPTPEFGIPGASPKAGCLLSRWFSIYLLGGALLCPVDCGRCGHEVYCNYENDALRLLAA